MQLVLFEELTGAAVGSVLQLPPAEARHVAAALRMASGERLLVSDGRGRRVVGTVQISGKDVHVSVDSCVDEPAPDPSITVVQALAKGEHAELAIDLMTQVGVDAVIPWAAQRSIVQLKGERADKALVKWQQAARAATKQSRRSWMPSIQAVVTGRELLASLAGFDQVFVLHEEADSPLATAPLPASGRICVIVGPEGGIAPQELDDFASAAALPVRLGPQVLRASLAGAVAVGVLATRLRWAGAQSPDVGG